MMCVGARPEWKRKVTWKAATNKIQGEGTTTSKVGTKGEGERLSGVSGDRRCTRKWGGGGGPKNLVREEAKGCVLGGGARGVVGVGGKRRGEKGRKGTEGAWRGMGGKWEGEWAGSNE